MIESFDSCSRLISSYISLYVSMLCWYSLIAWFVLVRSESRTTIFASIRVTLFFSAFISVICFSIFNILAFDFVALYFVTAIHCPNAAILSFGLLIGCLYVRVWYPVD